MTCQALSLQELHRLHDWTAGRKLELQRQRASLSHEEHDPDEERRLDAEIRQTDADLAALSLAIQNPVRASGSSPHPESGSSPSSSPQEPHP